MTFKYIALLLLLGIATTSLAQNHSIQVYFLYGSRPAKGYKKQEKKMFGGIHGGHVSIGVDDNIVGFGPVGKFHLLAKRRKNCHSGYRCEEQTSFNIDSVGKKYVTITIPLADSQYVKIQQIHNNYLNNPPYDYAFMGMRCAAASYDVLSQIGILKKKSHTATALSIFYPRRLRRRMLKMAKENGWKVHRKEGSKTRIWERE